MATTPLFERLATEACLRATPADRRRALSTLRPLLARVEHLQRAQCLTKRPIRALVDGVSGELELPYGDFVLKPTAPGAGEPFALAESATGVIMMLLEDEFSEVRLEAVGALAELAACDEKLVGRCAEMLVDTLTDDSEAVRAVALQRLSGIVGLTVLSANYTRAVFAALADGSAAVRDAALVAIRALVLSAEPSAADATPPSRAVAPSTPAADAADVLICDALDALVTCAAQRATAARCRAADEHASLVEAASALGSRHPHLLRALLSRARAERASAAQPSPPTTIARAITLSALLFAAFRAGPAGVSPATVPRALLLSSTERAAAARADADEAMAALPEWVWAEVSQLVGGSTPLRAPVRPRLLERLACSWACERETWLQDLDARAADAADALARADAAAADAALDALCAAAARTSQLDSGCARLDARLEAARSWYLACAAVVRGGAELHARLCADAPRAALDGASTLRDAPGLLSTDIGTARALLHEARAALAALSGLPADARALLALARVWASGWLALQPMRTALDRAALDVELEATALDLSCDERTAQLARALRALGGDAALAADVLACARKALRAHAPHALRVPSVRDAPLTLRTARVRVDDPAPLTVREGWPLELGIDVELGGWDDRPANLCALVVACVGGAHRWDFALRESDVVRRGADTMQIRARVRLVVPRALVDAELSVAFATRADGSGRAASANTQVGQSLRMSTAEVIPSVFLNLLGRTTLDWSS
jgi:hypothetical protein